MTDQRRRYFEPAALAAAFWLLYIATKTYAFSYDGLVHALDIEFGSLSNLFLNQNHLAYPLIGRIFFRALAVSDHTLRAVVILQQMNALAAGAGVGLFFFILQDSVGRGKALIGALALGLSRAFWMEASDPQSYALSGLMACALTGVVLQPEVRPAAGGIIQGLSILINQMFVLPVASFGWLIRDDLRKRTAAVLRPYAFFLVLIGAVPFALAAVILHPGSLYNKFLWLLGPAGLRPTSGIVSNSWWSANFRQNIRYSWSGFVESIVAAETLNATVRGLISGFTAAVLAAVSYLSLRRIRKRIDGYDIDVALWLWVIVMNLFQFFWAPGTPRFRILFLPPLFAVGLRTLPALPRRGFSAALALIALAAGINYSQSIGPRSNPNNNRDLIRVAWLSRVVKPNDFFLFAGTGPDTIVNVYAAYFIPQIHARSLEGYFFGSPRGNMKELEPLARDAEKRGGQVYCEASLFDPEVQKSLESYGGVPPGALAQWLGTFRKDDPLVGPEGYKVIPVSFSMIRRQDQR